MGNQLVPMPILDAVTKYTLDLFRPIRDLPLADNRVHLNSSGRSA